MKSSAMKRMTCRQHRFQDLTTTWRILLFMGFAAGVVCPGVAQENAPGFGAMALKPVYTSLYFNRAEIRIIQPTYCQFGKPHRISSTALGLTSRNNGTLSRMPLVTGKHEATFDKDGQFTSIIDSGHEGMFGTIFTYNSGNISSESQMIFNGKLVNDVQNNSPEYYHYAWQGRTITITPTDLSGKDLPNGGKEVQTFDSKGRIINDLTYEGKYKDNEYVYTYFPSGVAESITQIWFGLPGSNSMPTISNKWEYTYDRQGRLNTWTLYNGDPTDPQTIINRGELEYDHAGNVSKVTWNDGRVYTFRYQFDSMGNWTQQIWNRVTNGGGTSTPEREVDRVISYYPSEIGTITTDGLWIRSKPGLSATTMGFLNLEERVTVLETTTEKSTIDGKTSPWYRVRTATGLKGWIFGGYVTVRTEQ